MRISFRGQARGRLRLSRQAATQGTVCRASPVALDRRCGLRGVSTATLLARFADWNVWHDFRALQLKRDSEIKCLVKVAPGWHFNAGGTIETTEAVEPAHLFWGHEEIYGQSLPDAWTWSLEFLGLDLAANGLGRRYPSLFDGLGLNSTTRACYRDHFLNDDSTEQLLAQQVFGSRLVPTSFP